MLEFVNILADAAKEGGSPAFGLQFLPMLLIFGAMWFLLIAPQRKKQKKHAAMLETLTSGDRVITNAGIYGTIVNVKNDRFVLKISDDTKVEINKAFIQSKIEKDSE